MARGFMVTRRRTERSLRDTSVIVWVGWIVGLFFGSVFLAWLVGAARGSVLVVALWHTAYNFATATEAAAGSVAAVAIVAVVLATVWIMRAGVGPRFGGGGAVFARFVRDRDRRGPEGVA